MVIAFYKGQGNGGVKVIRAESGREKEKESSAMKLSLRNGRRGIMTIYYVTGTRIIPSKTPLERLLLFNGKDHMRL